MAPPAYPTCGYWQNGTWVSNGTCNNSPRCGSMQNGVWVPNGNCPDRRGMVLGRARVVGTITSVSGHMVTVQQSRGSVTIDDSRALSRQTTGHVAVGRQIVAFGHWRDGTFYATRIQ